MFDVIKETNMVYCAGCSFTYGQNLWFHNPLIYNRFKEFEEFEEYDKDKENQLWPYKATNRLIFDFNCSEDLFHWTDQKYWINDVPSHNLSSLL